MDGEPHIPRLSPAKPGAKGSREGAGHTDLGQESPPESQGALQVGIVQLFLLGFRCGAGMNAPSSATSPTGSQRALSCCTQSWAAPRGHTPAMPAPFQTFSSGNTKLKGMRTRSKIIKIITVISEEKQIKQIFWLPQSPGKRLLRAHCVHLSTTPSLWSLANLGAR